MNATIDNTVPVRSKTSALLAHPATRAVGVTLSYLGTAAVGWWLGKRIEQAVAKRALSAGAPEVHRDDRPRPGHHNVAQA
jgi:hypothetical protein